MRYTLSCLIGAVAVMLALSVGSASAPANPLIFGTNLLGFDMSDPFLDPDVRAAFRDDLNIPTIRFPIRDVGCATTEELAYAQQIADDNQVPMVILKFTQADPASAAECVVDQMNTIFGSNVVYYEYGNERDLVEDACGDHPCTKEEYTASWNANISGAVALANNGQFGGSVNFQANPTYIAYFVDNAVIKPDFVSWHEYTCGPGDSAQHCIDEVQDWEDNVVATRAAIAATGETVPPVWITEWNYDPQDPPDNDPRLTQQFITDFYTAALEELHDAQVTGAHHYRGAGHEPYELVEDNTGALSQQGIAFAAMYPHLIDSDGDGCTDEQEDGPTHQAGGQRDNTNPYDFYDVNGTRKVDSADIGLVRAHFGAENYDVFYDRTAGAAPWAPDGPNGAIDAVDIALVRASFNENCTASP